MSKKISKKVLNLIGLGIDFKSDITEGQEKSWKIKREKEIMKKVNGTNKDQEIKTDDLYCIVCGANVNINNLSCEGCGMEFNMDEKEARHMISLMIGMSWSDGVLDEAEKSCLIEYIDKIDISSGTKSRLKKEVNTPRILKNIVRWIKTPQAKRNTLRMATASAMVSKWDEKEYSYLEEAKKLLDMDSKEADNVIKKTEEYLKPLLGC
jgi:uncharacterized tellurite resistance protein B-like protein